MADENDALLGAYRDVKQKPRVDVVFFLVALLGAFLAMADDSIVLPTHGEIASKFGQSYLGPWFMTAYNLGYTISLPTYGRLCDMYGYRSTLLPAYFLFTTGCAITSFSGSIWVAIAGRFVAGFGGSRMVDIISIWVAEFGSLKEIAVLRSYIQLSTTVGIGLGAPVGGLLTDLVGWRWAFLGQVPLGLLCLAVGAWRLPSPEQPPKWDEEDGLKKQQTSTQIAESFDLPGVALLAGIVGLFMILCGSGDEETISSFSMSLTLLAVELSMILLFVLNETMWAKDPLIPFRLIKANGTGLICLAQCFIQFSLFGLLSNVTEFFVRVENISNARAGTYMLASPLGWAVGSMLSGSIIGRTGKYKTLGISTASLALLGYILTLLRWPNGTSPWELVYILFATLGIGALLTTQFMALSASIPKSKSGTIIAVYYMAQQIGIVLGTTISSSLCRRVFENNLWKNLETTPDAANIIRLALKSTRLPSFVSEGIRQIVQSSFLASFHVVPILSMCAIILVFPLLVSLPELPLE